MAKTYEITLSDTISDQLDHIAKRVYVSSESLILFLLLGGLREIQAHRKHLPFYRKILAKIEKEMNQ